MDQIITVGVLGSILVSFIIAFFMTRSREAQESFLFWTDYNGKNRLSYAVNSNLGSVTSGFVFICGVTLVAFAFGTYAAAVMIGSFILAYSLFALMLGAALRRKGSPWQVQIENWKGNDTPQEQEAHEPRLSIVHVLGSYFGPLTTSLCLLVMLAFIVFALASELVLFQNMLRGVLAETHGLRIGPEALTFLLLAICTLYTVRGGFEGVFKTDVFQMGVVVALFVALIWMLHTYSASPTERFDILSVVSNPRNACGFNCQAWLALSVFPFVVFAYAFGAIDQWNRTLLFIGNPKRTVKALVITGIGIAIIGCIAAYLGLSMRLWRPLADRFLVLENGIWNLRSFQDVTQLPFSGTALHNFAEWPRWFTMLAWAGIAAMALTTIDCLLLTIGQLFRQWSLLLETNYLRGHEASHPLSSRELRKPLTPLGQQMMHFVFWAGDNPRYVIGAGAGAVGLLAVVMNYVPYACAGLWGWSFQYLAAVLVLCSLLASRPSIAHRDAYTSRSLLWLIVVWLIAFAINLSLSIASPRTSTSTLPILTVLMGVGLMWHLMRKDHSTPSQPGGSR